MSNCKRNTNFLDTFSKHRQIPNFVKIRPVGAKSIHADGQADRQADMTKLVIDFRKLAKTPKKMVFDPFLTLILLMWRIG